MALDYLYGWTEAELLASLTELQDEYMELERITETSAGDSTARTMLHNLEERIALVKRSLYRLDNTDYADWQSEGETVTKAGFH